MNRKVLFFIIIGLIYLYRCFNSNEDKDTFQKIEKLVHKAQSFEGVNYRAGGTTKKGMDCSGLITTTFRSMDIKLPRSSESMSSIGIEISLDKIEKGDLLFFNIDRLKGNINHVGLVTSIEEEVLFIHSTTSKGVIYSSLNENYWKDSFVIAKRIITH